MKSKPKRNSAAVALGRLSGHKMTAEDRSTRARRAVQARWSRARGEPESSKIWHVFYYPSIALEHGLISPDKISDDSDLDWQLLFSSRDKAKALAFMRKEKRRPLGLFQFEGSLRNPPFTLERAFNPDLERESKALLTVLGEEETR